MALNFFFVWSSTYLVWITEILPTITITATLKGVQLPVNGVTWRSILLCKAKVSSV